MDTYDCPTCGATCDACESGCCDPDGDTQAGFETSQIATDTATQQAETESLFVIAVCRICDRDLLALPDELDRYGLTECQEHSERYAISYEDDPDVPNWDELADRAAFMAGDEA